MQECMWAAWDYKQQNSTVYHEKKEFVGAILDEVTGRLLEYQQLVTIPQFNNKWQHLFENESGLLAQGMSEWI